MKIETVITGALEENCYVLIKDNTCLVVDPGDDYPKIQEAIKDNKGKVIFIIDECHRSNFGEMRKHILRAFPDAQMFGFTGTPIFAENMNATGLTTEAIFGGKPVHSYKIKDAINARMVLGFNVQYYKTINIVYHI